MPRQHSFADAAKDRIEIGAQDDLRHLQRAAKETIRRATILLDAIDKTLAGDDLSAVIDSMTDGNSQEQYRYFLRHCVRLQMLEGLSMGIIKTACKNMPPWTQR